MNRLLTYLVGPETVLLVVNLLAFGFCARHASGEERDLRLMEHCLWTLPPLAVVAAFLTFLIPGAQTWGWLVRAIGVSFVGTGFLAWRIVEGFGNGAKGQDAAFIVAFCLVGLVIGLGTALVSAGILVHRNAAVAEWFRARPIASVALTLVASIPVSLVLLTAMTIGGGFLLGLGAVFRR